MALADTITAPPQPFLTAAHNPQGSSCVAATISDDDADSSGAEANQNTAMQSPQTSAQNDGIHGDITTSSSMLCDAMAQISAAASPPPSPYRPGFITSSLPPPTTTMAATPTVRVAAVDALTLSAHATDNGNSIEIIKPVRMMSDGSSAARASGAAGTKMGIQPDTQPGMQKDAQEDTNSGAEAANPPDGQSSPQTSPSAASAESLPERRAPVRRKSSMRQPCSTPRRSSSVQFNASPSILNIPSRKRMTRKDKQKQWCTDQDLQNAKEECLQIVQNFDQSQYVVPPAQLRGLEMFDEKIAIEKARTSLHSVAVVLQEQHKQKAIRQHLGAAMSPQQLGPNTTIVSPPIVLNDEAVSQVYARRTESSRQSAAEVALIDQQEVQEYIQHAEEEVRREHAEAAARGGVRKSLASPQGRKKKKSSRGFLRSLFRNPFKRRHRE